MAPQQPRDVGSMRKRWNTNSVLVGVGQDIWDQLSDPESYLLRWRIGTSFDEGDLDELFSVKKDGTCTAVAFVGDGSGLTGISGGGGGGTIVDTAFDNTWNGDTTQGASRNALYDQFIVVAGTVTSEAATRLAADNALDTRLDTIEADYLTSAKIDNTAYDATSWNTVTTIAPSKDAVRDKFVTVDAAIASEATTRGNADTTLQSNIASEAATRAAADTSLDALINGVYNTLAGVDNSLDGRLDIIEADYLTSAKIDNTAYDATSWNSVSTIAPSKDAVRDKFVTVDAAIAALVSDTAYDATSWNAVVDVAPSKNAVRDKFVTVDAAIAALLSDTAFASSWNGVVDAAPSKNAVYDAIAPRAISFGAATGANTTVYLTTYARFPFTIDSIQNIQTTSGTISLAVRINGTNVTGLSAVAVTSTSQDVNATAANTVAIGDEITMVWSSNASAIDIRGTLLITKTG